jgi:electron transfer flavoprotein beta subunit
MNIFVCIKRVPDTTTRIKIGGDGKSIDLQGVEFVISPYDELALELALRLKEKAGAGEVVAVSVDPDGNETILRKALAIGADRGILLKGGAAQDPALNAEILAGLLKTRKFDLLLFGRQAIDDDAAEVPTLVAHALGIPRVNTVSSFEPEGGKAKCRRQIEGGEEVLEVPLPCALSVQKGINGIHDPRYASLKGIMAAKKKTIETPAAAAAEARFEIVRMEPPPPRPPGRIVGQGVEAVPELVRLLREEAKVL